MLRAKAGLPIAGVDPEELLDGAVQRESGVQQDGIHVSLELLLRLVPGPMRRSCGSTELAAHYGTAANCRQDQGVVFYTTITVWLDSSDPWHSQSPASRSHVCKPYPVSTDTERSARGGLESVAQAL